MPDTPHQIITTLGQQAKAAAGDIAQANTESINQTLFDLADILIAEEISILEANTRDVEQAKTKGLTPALIDRLTLDTDRLHAIAQSVRDIATLDDPVGHILESTTRPNGLVIEKVSVPIGVLGMIYESRPNVTIDAAALCLKSHNAVILRGGSESFHSSTALHGCVTKALEKNNLPVNAVQIMPSTDRALVDEMLGASDYIDVIIPRGGKGLTGKVMNDAKMPVFAHLDGNCHIYIHESADEALALEVIKNAKLRRTGICGAVESLLFDSTLERDVIQKILDMLNDNECVVMGDVNLQKMDERVEAASDNDWATEYLDKKISAKMVDDIDEAITHINHYGSHHTDCILAEETNAVTAFQNRVDSAIVMHNASTQFADGGEFGFGAEIGIGTGKLHARGPVGLKQLVTFKYLVKGSGQTRT